MLERIWVGMTAALYVGLLGTPAMASGDTLRIVAAENFYGDVAQQLAGPHARVISVLHNPDADPHLFETDIATARSLAAANLVIYNGAGYDTWMPRLLAGAPVRDREAIEVARLLPTSPLGNPHLWYDPATMPALARALAVQLQRLDPAHSAEYALRLKQFVASLQTLEAQIARLHRLYAGVPIGATEPIANDLTDAIGLSMRNRDFQLAIMNNTEPGARETAAFEESLANHRIRLLVYNRQASNSAVQRLLAIARRSGVPIVGVSETEPPGMDYQQWMRSVLQGLDAALASGAGAARDRHS